ncbi:hypothetical protein AB0A05_26855 [Streptomyces sp. NPDC046374]|uniref:hypothetical protein n=1 Tax=Streptomyces sp. NPDC046374 TaxID=3154917 RepID=UPI0033D40776
MTIIDKGHTGAVPAAGDQGPFYVWRRRSDGYAGVSRMEMDREHFEPLHVTADWPEARAWVLVERYGFKVDEAVEYEATVTRWPEGSVQTTERAVRQVPGARLLAELRDCFRCGPYDGAGVNEFGVISLTGKTERDGEAAMFSMAVFVPKAG